MIRDIDELPELPGHIEVTHEPGRTLMVIQMSRERAWSWVFIGMLFGLAGVGLLFLAFGPQLWIVPGGAWPIFLGFAASFQRRVILTTPKEIAMWSEPIKLQREHLAAEQVNAIVVDSHGSRDPLPDQGVSVGSTVGTDDGEEEWQAKPTVDVMLKDLTQVALTTPMPMDQALAVMEHLRHGFGR